MSCAARIANALRPPQRLSVAPWADKYRVLGRTSAEPGRWRTDRVPYMREIMDDLTPGSGVVQIAVMKPSQVSATELILNAIGHSMMIDPGPGAIVQPTLSAARQFVLRRLDPMLESTPELDAMLGPRKQNSDNSLSYKAYPGGFLKIANASSPAELASDPLRYTYADEVDRWEGDVGGEGDPVQLLRARTITFGRRRRFLAVSTPVWEGRSRIQSLYEEGDQRRYEQPCPHCAAFFVIEWETIEWADEDQTVAVTHCTCCGSQIGEEHRAKMLANGRWRATAEAPEGIRSYLIDGVMSPWQRWADMLRAVEEAVASGSNDRLRVVWNTVIGRPFRGGDREALEWKRLYERRGQGRRGVVPASASVIVAGADVQADRIEVKVLALTEGWRQHIVDYLVLPGDPSQQQVWDDLGAVLEKQWSVQGTDVRIRIERMGLDTGYCTHKAYAFARKHGLHRVVAIKGTGYRSDIIGRPTPNDIDGPNGRIPNGVHVWPVGGDHIKDMLHHWLKLRWDNLEEMPEGWCSWPDLDEEYFKQVCAEQRVQRGKTWEWEKIRARNEALDCWVYAIAAAYARGIQRWTQHDWRERVKQRQVPTAQPKEAQRFSDSSWLQGR